MTKKYKDNILTPEEYKRKKNEKRMKRRGKKLK
jgi:hypothetical protein